MACVDVSKKSCTLVKTAREHFDVGAVEFVELGRAVSAFAPGLVGFVDEVEAEELFAEIALVEFAPHDCLVGIL